MGLFGFMDILCCVFFLFACLLFSYELLLMEKWKY